MTQSNQYIYICTPWKALAWSRINHAPVQKCTHQHAFPFYPKSLPIKTPKAPTNVHLRTLQSHIELKCAPEMCMHILHTQNNTRGKTLTILAHSHYSKHTRNAKTRA